MFCYWMKIYNSKIEMSAKIEALKSQKKRIGFVPTMGALHQGHLSLVKLAIEQNDEVVLSIFVNPTQFNNPEDLKKYPRSLDRDVALLNTISDDVIVYAPTVEEIYGNEVVSTHYDYDGLEHEMEGKFRPGHFDGVGTIIKRLFEIIKPDNAYFGKKDFQQLRIIQKLVRDQHLPVRVIGCEIFREKDGLAMSSRNERLTPAQRKAATFIYKTLKTVTQQFGTISAEELAGLVSNQFAKHELLELEYFIIADEETLQPMTKKYKKKSYRAFIAVFADDIRLIDNIALN